MYDWRKYARTEHLGEDKVGLLFYLSHDAGSANLKFDKVAVEVTLTETEVAERIADILNTLPLMEGVLTLNDLRTQVAFIRLKYASTNPIKSIEEFNNGFFYEPSNKLLHPIIVAESNRGLFAIHVLDTLCMFGCRYIDTSTQ